MGEQLNTVLKLTDEEFLWVPKDCGRKGILRERFGV